MTTCKWCNEEIHLDSGVWCADNARLRSDICCGAGCSGTFYRHEPAKQRYSTQHLFVNTTPPPEEMETTRIPRMTVTPAQVAAMENEMEPRTVSAETADRMAFLELINDAVEEAHTAMVRYPQPNYVISKIAEESGEVVKAAIHFAEGRETASNLRSEMKQTIAMLYRLWIEGDQVHHCPPVLAAYHKETRR